MDDPESVWDIGQARSTTLGANNGVLVTIRGTEDASGNEEAEGCALWGIAGVISRPQDATDPRAAQLLFFRGDDDLIGFASRDLRYQVATEKGELAIHALGKTAAIQAVVRCKPNGDVIIGAESIRLGTLASQHVVHGDLLASRMATLLAALGAFATAVEAAEPSTSAAAGTLNTAIGSFVVPLSTKVTAE